METKKTKRANIEGHRGTWLLVGTVVVLSFMFISFEWNIYDKEYDESAKTVDPVFVQVMVPITIQEDELKPPAPPKPQINMEQLLIVDNKTDEPDTEIDFEPDVRPIQGAVIVPPVVAPPVIETDEVEVFVEIMPSFPGGQEALMEFLRKYLKYPPIPEENGVQGRVIIQFIVDKDGSITDPVVAKGIDPYLDKEAMRVVKLMPAWTPGIQQGRAVRVKYTLPIVFKINR